MKEIIEKLLKEVDGDIATFFLEDSDAPETFAPMVEGIKQGKDIMYPKWALLPDPTGTILRWQELRDRKPKLENDRCLICGQNHGNNPFNHIIG